MNSSGTFDYTMWKEEKIRNNEWDGENESRLRVIMEKEREVKELKRKWNMLDLQSHNSIVGAKTRSSTARQVVLDTETTGFYNSDGIVELSILEIVNGVYTGVHIHYYINPIIKSSEAAEKVHNLTCERLKGQPIFEQFADNIISFIGHSQIIAHNARFDMRMLNNELQRAGWMPYPETQFIDTLKIAREQFPGEKNSLDALCTRFQIDNQMRSETGNHNAFDDTLLLYEVYKRLMCYGS